MRFGHSPASERNNFKMACRKSIDHHLNKQTAPVRFVSDGGVSFFGEGLVGSGVLRFQRPHFAHEINGGQQQGVRKSCGHG